MIQLNEWILSALLLSSQLLLHGQTCTTNQSGDFDDASIWTCTGGVTWQTAAELDVTFDVTIPNNQTLTIAAERLTIASSTTLTFGSNAQLIMSTPGAYVELQADGVLEAGNNSSGTLIEINGAGVWGNACAGCSNATLTGPGFITETSDPADPLQSSVVPVDWLDFYFDDSGESALLVWVVANTIIHSHFVVQASENGDAYTDMATVVTSGDHTTAHSYQYKRRGGDTHTYYRVKQVDFDGSYSYSPTIALPLQLEREMLQTYPNPAGADLWVTGLNEGHNYQVYNALGEQVLAGRVEVGGPISVATLATGMQYILVLPDLGESTSFVK